MSISFYSIIDKKKRGLKLTREEIDFTVTEYTAERIPDYQMASLLMAICIQGMDDEEISALTEAMARSGDMLDLSEFASLSVDKHSTGGVGDKTTLIAAPIAAALGCKVTKMSGRGLGHTGGTVDKLESIRGYRCTLSDEEFLSQVKKIGIAVIGQSKNLAPADKRIYALRDVTATVDSIPLITASIMSKKLAAGTKNIVLDVKYGSGAFMKTAEDAYELARKMVDIGTACKRNVAALITDMNEPLGCEIGNICEIKEAIKVLHGCGPRDLTEVSLSIAAAMVSLSSGIEIEDAEKKAHYALYSGEAFKKFREWIYAQGGDLRYIDTPELFDAPKEYKTILAPRDGFIEKTDAEKIGLAAVALGAGRQKKDDEIDFTAGITLLKKRGDFVKSGEPIARLYTTRGSLPVAEEIFSSAIEYSAIPSINKAPLIINRIYSRAK